MRKEKDRSRKVGVAVLVIASLSFAACVERKVSKTHWGAGDAFGGQRTQDSTGGYQSESPRMASPAP